MEYKFLKGLWQHLVIEALHINSEFWICYFQVIAVIFILFGKTVDVMSDKISGQD